ncbi:MAG TPA: tyrosine-type recombinase/integrase, partial [Bacteroidales bacterium]|nr:tyrosine-type recombinase/integrase [Bacteroidales bacterium]
VKVLGKRNKERIIPFSSRVKELLLKYVEFYSERVGEVNKNCFIFVDSKLNKIYSKAVYRIVRKYLDMVTTIDKRSPHVLRHTFATHLLNRGADINAIKEILGHSSLAATQIYTHNSVEKLKNIYKQAHPRA